MKRDTNDIQNIFFQKITEAYKDVLSHQITATYSFFQQLSLPATEAALYSSIFLLFLLCGIFLHLKPLLPFFEQTQFSDSALQFPLVQIFSLPEITPTPPYLQLIIQQGFTQNLYVSLWFIPTEDVRCIPTRFIGYHEQKSEHESSAINTLLLYILYKRCLRNSWNTFNNPTPYKISRSSISEEHFY